MKETKATEIEVEIKGRKVLVPPLRLTALSKLAQEFESAGNAAMLQAACLAGQNMPLHVAQMLRSDALAAIANNRAHTDAVLIWLQTTIEGSAAGLYWALEDKYPGEFSRADAFAALERMFAEEPGKLNELRAARDAEFSPVDVPVSPASSVPLATASAAAPVAVPAPAPDGVS